MLLTHHLLSSDAKKPQALVLTGKILGRLRRQLQFYAQHSESRAEVGILELKWIYGVLSPSSALRRTCEPSEKDSITEVCRKAILVRRGGNSGQKQRDPLADHRWPEGEKCISVCCHAML